MQAAINPRSDTNMNDRARVYAGAVRALNLKIDALHVYSNAIAVVLNTQNVDRHLVFRKIWRDREHFEEYRDEEVSVSVFVLFGDSRFQDFRVR